MVMTESFNAVICDAGPIIHLDELGYLELLNDFQKILLPRTVSKEIKLHRPSALENPAINFTPCLHEGPLNEPLHTMCKTFSLDAGEIEALAVMEKNPAFIFITDDASARLVADKMGFKMGKGTVSFYLGEYTKALSLFEAAIHINPDDHKIWSNKGNALDAIGRHEEANSSIQQSHRF